MKNLKIKTSIVIITISLVACVAVLMGSKFSNGHAAKDTEASTAPIDAEKRDEQAAYDPSYVNPLLEQGLDEDIIKSMGPGFFRVIKKRPFEVTHKSDSFEWTAEDATTEENIKVLSNNSLQEEYYKLENEFVDRRELVYFSPEELRKEHEAVLKNELKEVALPGFDGEEIKVAVLQTSIDDPEVSGMEEMSGNWQGYLLSKHTPEQIETYRNTDYPQDRPDLEVFAVMQGNSWSISIANEDGTTYSYSSRLPGEWVLAEHNNAKEMAFVGSGEEYDIHDVGQILSE